MEEDVFMCVIGICKNKVLDYIMFDSVPECLIQFSNVRTIHLFLVNLWYISGYL